MRRAAACPASALVERDSPLCPSYLADEPNCSVGSGVSKDSRNMKCERE